MELLGLIVYVVVALMLLYVTFSYARSLVQVFRGKFVPFVPTSGTVLPYLQKILTLNEKSVLYDLGAGDGRIVRTCHDACPNATCIGIEKQYGPYLLAWLRHRKKFCDRFRVIRGDIFDYSYANATHITTYLFPEIMDRLLPKLQKELRPGTMLVSIDFPFEGKTYKDVIHTSGSLRLTGRKIYVYEF